jgi:hypothetical protein
MESDGDARPEWFGERKVDGDGGDASANTVVVHETFS